MGSLDATYAELLQSLSAEERALAATLSHRLGFADENAGGYGWDSFFRLGPNRQLPTYAVPANGFAAQDEVAAFVRAHHLFAFHGMLADRLADRQAESTPGLEALERAFASAALRALADACGDEADAAELVGRDRRCWAEGVAQERAALCSGRLSLDLYADVVIAKLDWVGTTAGMLARRAAGDASARQFRLAHRLLLLSLQCLDDATDVADDRRSFGNSVPDALRLPSGGLVRASGRLASAAARVAGEGGFERFSRWLFARGEELSRVGGEGSPTRNELAGFAVAAALEERCRAGPVTSC